MQGDFISLLCSKLCRHKIRMPSGAAGHETRFSVRVNEAVRGYHVYGDTWNRW